MSALVEVDVVRAHVPDFSDLTRFRDVLDHAELARAAAYKVDEPRDVFCLARGVLRLELAKRLGVDARDVEFAVRSSGKPDVRRRASALPDWRFSVSHTGPHVAIAFALGLDVGIDIEPSNRKVNPLEIAKRYFTPSEYRALEALSANERTRAFFAGWTRKEAVVKARGATMAESLTTLTVDIDPNATHPDATDDPATGSRALCRLTSFELIDLGLIGCVAVQSHLRPRLRFQVLSAKTFD
jgi:4'-phosphopantetheinyl transferase